LAFFVAEHDDHHLAGSREIFRRLYRRSGAQVTEIKGASHVSFISHPAEVAAVIEAAAESGH